MLSYMDTENKKVENPLSYFFVIAVIFKND